MVFLYFDVILNIYIIKHITKWKQLPPWNLSQKPGVCDYIYRLSEYSTVQEHNVSYHLTLRP